MFASDGCSLARAGAALAFDFTLGALLGRTRTHGLLDTAPLAGLLGREFPSRGIAEGIRRGRLYAVAVSATSYHSGRSFTFVEGRPGHPVWAKSRRLVLPVTLDSRHVLASSAIPIVFPPVRVSSQAGDLWFGDGGLRLVTPLSPAIRLGATHILSLGVRSSRAADALAHEEVGAAPSPEDGPPRLPCPPLAQVTGVFLNAIFLDHLDADLDHLARMNEIVAQSQVRRTGLGRERADPQRAAPRAVSHRKTSPSWRSASRIACLACCAILLDGLGTPDAQSADLMSYLLFDAAYTRTLVDLGRRDAEQRIGELEAFVAAAPALAAPVAAVRTLSAGRRHAASTRAPSAPPG